MSLKQPVIAQIVPELSAGGVEQGTIDVAGHLVQAGCRALVISNGGNRLHELKRVGAEHISMPSHSKNPLTIHSNVKALQDIMLREGVDVLHARSRAPAWSAYYACKDTPCKFVTTFHAPYRVSNKLKQMYNAVMAKGERVIAISRHVEGYIQENYVVPPERVRLIHRGVDTEKFHPSRVSAERMITLAKEWRIPDGAPVVLLPGRLTRWKGHLEFLDAFAATAHPDAIAVLVGDDQGRDKYRAEIEAKITEKGLESKVRLVSHCSDMPAAYMLSAVVVSASVEPEGFGRVPIEGQAMGKPIVATNHGGAAETVLHGETGWLAEVGNVQAMAQSLNAALTLTDGQRSLLAHKAMRHIEQNFTKHLMCEKTLDVYAELLREKYSGELKAA